MQPATDSLDCAERGFDGRGGNGRTVRRRLDCDQRAQ
jgi:hypothetical protein